jgi:hypothetical protein
MSATTAAPTPAANPLEGLPPEIANLFHQAQAAMPDIQSIPAIRAKLQELERPKSKARILMSQLAADTKRRAENATRAYTLLNKLDEMETREPEVVSASDTLGFFMTDAALRAAKDPTSLDLASGLQVYAVLEQAKAKAKQARQVLNTLDTSASMLDSFQAKQAAMENDVYTGVGFAIGGGLLVGIAGAAFGAALPACAALFLVGVVTFGLGYWLYTQLASPPAQMPQVDMLLATLNL